MVVERHCQMVPDQILRGNTEIHRIPVLELFAESFKFIFSNIATFFLVVSFAKENVVKCTDAQLIGLDSRWSSL